MNLQPPGDCPFKSLGNQRLYPLRYVFCWTVQSECFGLINLIYFKVIQNDGKLKTMLEQKFVFKFLLGEKCQTNDVYWRVCDVYEDACFNLKNAY